MQLKSCARELINSLQPISSITGDLQTAAEGTIQQNHKFDGSFTFTIWWIARLHWWGQKGAVSQKLADAANSTFADRDHNLKIGSCLTHFFDFFKEMLDDFWLSLSAEWFCHDQKLWWGYPCAIEHKKAPQSTKTDNYILINLYSDGMKKKGKKKKHSLFLRLNVNIRSACCGCTCNR